MFTLAGNLEHQYLLYQKTRDDGTAQNYGWKNGIKPRYYWPKGFRCTFNTENKQYTV